MQITIRQLCINLI